ncbi:MAG: toll/interleukin-1 receptor domain-containing protein [Candidatus Eisenbacteria bacterium]|nr:toll/interleukin-1 receptor domain-containing protein [Candidatus Eisenbacteria bacterium]
MAGDGSFDEEVFFSYASEDLHHVRQLARRLWDEYRISSFVADDALKDLARGDRWEQTLLEKVTRCRFFALYASRSVMASAWVNREVQRFFEGAYSRDNRRKMFVLTRTAQPGAHLPAILRDFLWDKDEDELVRDIVAELIRFLSAEKTSARDERDKLASQLEAECESAAKKVREAFGHYGQTRFWKPFSRHGHLHIFTCGRDVPPEKHRGSGGRTNIDRWDYQTVLQITHFFAENFPGTKVTIEDPVAKLAAEDLTGARLGHRVAGLMRQLEDKDCVVIGSPDVSDFAEIVLAELHGTQSFAEGTDKLGRRGREKRRGFALIKAEMKAPSSTYWLKTEDEEVGVKWIETDKQFSVIEEDGLGTTYGVLVVCDNPFVRASREHKVIIFSGFSGVATYGMSWLLTSIDALSEFFKIDQRFGSLDTDFEALVEVQYAYELEGRAAGDRRRLIATEPVRVEAMVEIPRLV